MKELRRLLRERATRRATGRYVVEGPVLVGDAVAAGAPIVEVYAEPGALAPEVLATLREAGTDPTPVQAGALARVLDTTTPQPVAAVIELPDHGLEDATGRTDLVVVLVDVGDPGNTGTLVRTAEAAGAGAVVCCASTADAFAPKAVRASAGSVLRVPVVVDRETGEVLDALDAGGVTTLGLAAGGADAYDRTDLTGPLAVLLGNEAHGLPEDVVARVGRVVSIPMAGRVESLNVATAGAIVCFEAARQRRAR